jgi:gas vesicle protein
MSDSPDYRNYDYAGDAMRWLAAGFGIGLLVGGALGVLLAPKPGTETREQLKGLATDFGERARVVAGDYGERARTTASGIRDKATTTYGQVADSATGAAGDLSKTAKTVSSTITDGISTIKSASTRFQQAVKDGYIKKMEELGGSEAEAFEEPIEETAMSADETPKPRVRKRKDAEGEETSEM